MKLKSKPIRRKEALTIADLCFLDEKYRHKQSHDDLLFVALIFSGFFGLLRLGDMTFPDNPNIREWRKISRRSSLLVERSQISFLLPTHKGDNFFEGNKVLIHVFDPNSIDSTLVFV
jgi:hypothetical protein